MTIQNPIEKHCAEHPKNNFVIDFDSYNFEWVVMTKNGKTLIFPFNDFWDILKENRDKI